MPPISVYLAGSPSADRPRELLDDEIEQLSAQLKRAKALKAATTPSQQQAAPLRRLMEPSTSYGSLHDKYVPPYSYSSLYSFAYALGVPAVASAARYTYADVRPFEHAFSPGGARITECPRESRPSVVATTVLPLSASIFNLAAAPLPALAASVAALQASHEAPLVAASNLSVPSAQAPPAATQSTPLRHPSEAPNREARSSSAFSIGGKGGAAQPPGKPPGDPDNDPDKKKRDNEIDLKRKGQFLSDSAALKSAKGRTRGNMKCEVGRFERGTDLTIKD